MGTIRRFTVILLFLALPALSRGETEPPFTLPNQADLNRIQSAALYTSRGTIYLKLFPTEAPWHVANFKYLADKGFYRNLSFHYYEPGYVIQTGAPNAKPNSGPGYSLPPEFNTHLHVAGIVSMVRRPDELDLERGRRSHGSQFRIFLKPAPHMDGNYTVFGEVIRGMNVVEALRKGDVLEEVKVFVSME